MADFYTVFQLKKDVDANLHAGGTAGLQDFYATLDKGRRSLIKYVRPPELLRTSYLEDAVYPHVDRYILPNEFKYSDLIEMKLLAGYRNIDTMSYPTQLVYRKRFGQKRGRERNVMYIGYENGYKYANVFHPRGQEHITRHLLIHDCNSLSDNGSWNVGGNVVNLKLDELNFIEKTGSFSFDINNSATTGFIENFTLTPFDLADFLQKGAVFDWLNVPLPKELLAVKLTLGSNTTNLTTDLFTSVVNQPHDNTVFTSGWNLLKFMLNNLTSVGTPNPKDLKYVRFDFTTTGQPIPGMGIDLIIARLGGVYEITYNSTYILKDAVTGAFKKIGTANSDIIVGEEDTYDLLMWETTVWAQKELYGTGQASKTDVASVEDERDKAYAKYKLEHKSEAVVETDSMRIFGNEYDGYTDTPENEAHTGLWGEWD